MAIDASWKCIFDKCGIAKHNFEKGPFYIRSEQIKTACQDFKKTGEKEVRILCKSDTREDRPEVLAERGLFLLPVKNGTYAIVKGEGYVDISPILGETEIYESSLDYKLDTSLVGNSEMQHLDFAYASSLLRTFMGDTTLVLTIRGRKFTPQFTFRVGGHEITVKGVQTEVDAGYEGKNQVVLIEAKSAGVHNTIIRQLYYPLRQWQTYTKKDVVTLFFEKAAGAYSFWHFRFRDLMDYNSIELVKAAKFKIKIGS